MPSLQAGHELPAVEHAYHQRGGDESNRVTFVPKDRGARLRLSPVSCMASATRPCSNPWSNSLLQKGQGQEDELPTPPLVYTQRSLKTKYRKHFHAISIRRVTLPATP